MKNKKGMSIAAVMGILVCLVSLVTTCFLFAVRSSILTSRSLKYIESYNDASTSIDNAVNFLSDQMNAKYKLGDVTGKYVEEISNSVEGLFGVNAVTSSTETETAIDMSTGVIITIKKEYYKVNSNTDYLISIVKFSATTIKGQSVITSDLAFDKGTSVELADMIKSKYNSANLLLNYWVEQALEKVDKNDFKPKDSINKLVNAMGITSEHIFKNAFGGAWLDDKKDHTGNGNVASTFIQILQNQLEQKSDKFESVSNFSDLYNDRQVWYPEQKIVPGKLKVNGQNAAIVIDSNIRVDNATDLVGKKVQKLNSNYQVVAEYDRVPIYVTNNSILFFRNGLKADCDIYVERGSTIFAQGGAGIEIHEYNSNGAKVAPIFDCDYVSPDVIKKEAKEGTYVGGGAFVKGDFVYAAENSNGLLLKDNRYDYFKKVRTAKDAYFNGNITCSGKFKVVFESEDNESVNKTKLPLGATVYTDSETSISNCAFYSDTEKVRPFLLFCNNSINLKYNCSLVDGKTVAYKNESSWTQSEGKKCGFAIITCEKVKTLKGDGNLVFMNMFYNDEKEAKNDKSDINLLNAMKDMQGTSGYAKYGVHNGFVNKNALAGCSSNIEADAIHWYIPSKLRGSMISASISANQSRV